MRQSKPYYLLIFIVTVTFFMFDVLAKVSNSTDTIATKKHSWVFFDLGDTIIDTKNKHALKYIKGARTFLLNLKNKGYQLGIISNTPEKWGDTKKKQISNLKKFVDEHWKDKDKFHWEDFNSIILPTNHIQRKPAPFLYEQAINLSEGCPSMFIGENAIEVKAAHQIGMAKHQIGLKNKPFFPYLHLLENKLKAQYKHHLTEDCIQYTVHK